jgi:Sulfotransferase domain
MLDQIKNAVRLSTKEIEIYLRRKNYEPKVFCVGFNKTGTTSIGKALEMLGYDHSSFNQKVWLNYYLKGRFDKVIEYAAKYQSFDDLPWLKEDLIPILDESFVGSKYIYLERDEISWKRSFGRWNQVMFGTSPDANAGWTEYLRHREFVLNYFRDRSPREFIILEVSDPIGFRKLADFLGRTAHQDALPHYNSTDDLARGLGRPSKPTRFQT